MQEGPGRVLVADGGMPRSRTALATVRALGQAGYEPDVTTGGLRSLAASSRHCRGRVTVPPVEDPTYADAVRGAAASEDYVAVIATSDRALLALGGGATALVDKRRLAVAAADVGFAVPVTTELSSYTELLETADATEFPIVVKPIMPPAKAFEVRDRATLPREAPWPGPVLVQPSLQGAVRAVCGVSWDGELFAVVHQQTLRTWPVRCGVSCSAYTVEPDFELEARVAALVRDHRGMFQAQLLGDHLIDLNLRPYGTLPLAVAAGANLAAIQCQLAAGQRPPLVRGRPGTFFRWLDADVRHLVGEVGARRLSVGDALSAMRPRRHTAHATESLADPRPMLRRLWLSVAAR